MNYLKILNLDLGNAYNAKVWLGLYDFKTRISLDTKDDESIREFIVQKYEKKRYFVDPAHVRHTVEPEPEKILNGPSLHSPPSKFSSGLIGSTLLMHKGTPTPPATALIAKPASLVSATPPSVKMTPPPVIAERASTSSASPFTSPPPLSSVSLSKPSPFTVLNTPPVKQNADPFGAVATSPPTMNDFFGGKNDSFANFDSANIYSNPTSNPVFTKASSHSTAQINFGLAPVQNVPLPASAAPAPVQAIQETKKPIMSTTQQEDKYAALKDLDNIFKTSVELSSKPVIGDPDPFQQVRPASNPSSNRTYNPFATDFASSQQLNTSPWPTTGSPSGPGFSSASGGFGATPAKAPDFFPSPWDAPAAASAAPNPTDFFSSKNFNNPWSETSDNDKFGQFGFNKKNPFL